MRVGHYPADPAPATAVLRLSCAALTLSLVAAFGLSWYSFAWWLLLLSLLGFSLVPSAHTARDAAAALLQRARRRLGTGGSDKVYSASAASGVAPGAVSTESAPSSSAAAPAAPPCAVASVVCRQSGGPERAATLLAGVCAFGAVGFFALCHLAGLSWPSYVADEALAALAAAAVAAVAASGSDADRTRLSIEVGSALSHVELTLSTSVTSDLGRLS